MDSLVQDRIYRRVTLMDYQGVCPDTENPYTATSGPMPRSPFHWIAGYMMTFAMNWLTFLPNALHAWPQYESQQYSEGDEDFEENYNDDYNTFEYSPSEEDATIPDVVSSLRIC